ncbi:hypothetical protein FHS42_007341 [Streptomyces zagrosensis]|uniref:Uncharacterized protein n=1 Tax=Streptomyces zagrosensis TaxID=1042984 RepID=A0A7W9QIA4_9ACTN|nr:hypothetical protein [Streptomyces zagrosensis]MBB5940243.1 hypothetical protein [Streptomyces zagrosensis]
MSGTKPIAKAIGALTGPAIKSAGRTHTPHEAQTNRKASPYTAAELDSNSASRQPTASMATVASMPAPNPVSFGSGSLRTAASSGSGSGPPLRAR